MPSLGGRDCHRRDCSLETKAWLLEEADVAPLRPPNGLTFSRKPRERTPANSGLPWRAAWRLQRFVGPLRLLHSRGFPLRDGFHRIPPRLASHFGFPTWVRHYFKSAFLTNHDPQFRHED